MRKTNKLQVSLKHDVNEKRFNVALEKTKSLMKKNMYYNNDDFVQAVAIVRKLFTSEKTNYTLIKQGNHKLGKNVYIWDMPSIITCKYACKNCYALKSERIYKNTRVMRLYHLILILYYQNYRPFEKILKQAMINELLNASQNKNIIVRLHASGDFFMSDYLFYWLDIIKELENNNNIHFYTYTKCLDNYQIDGINTSYKHFNIVKSLINIDNKNYINFGNAEYVEKTYNKLKEKNMPCYICSYGTDKPKTCMGTCHACLHCPHVLFYQH